MRFLLDTNICIYLMKGHPRQVVERFTTIPLGRVQMSAVTYAELRHGVERCPPQDRTAADDALQGFIERVPVMPFHADAAKSYGVLAAAGPDRRRNAMDRLIAAHAVSAGVTLVTNNEADFKDYPGLVVDNWAVSL